MKKWKPRSHKFQFIDFYDSIPKNIVVPRFDGKTDYFKKNNETQITLNIDDKPKIMKTKMKKSKELNGLIKKYLEFKDVTTPVEKIDQLMEIQSIIDGWIVEAEEQLFIEQETDDYDYYGR